MNLRIIILFTVVCLINITVGAQKSVEKVQLSGQITDANNKPIKDVVLMVDNVKIDTYINSKGFYKIKIPRNTKSIIAFSVNYGLKEHMYDGESIVDFKFEVKETQANYEDGQKVNVGYGSIDKDNLTTSVGVVEGKVNQHYRNIYEMIAGKVPGVTVTGNRILIRGISSFNASTDPLLVVDGQVVQSIDDIPPSEVDNISILKGSEAAMYGSRGGNGVILITLKKAKRVN